jgi:hypothetical protein
MRRTSTLQPLISSQDSKETFPALLYATLPRSTNSRNCAAVYSNANSPNFISISTQEPTTNPSYPSNLQGEYQYPAHPTIPAHPKIPIAPTIPVPPSTPHIGTSTKNIPSAEPTSSDEEVCLSFTTSTECNGIITGGILVGTGCGITPLGCNETGEWEYMLIGASNNILWAQKKTCGGNH